MAKIPSMETHSPNKTPDILFPVKRSQKVSFARIEINKKTQEFLIGPCRCMPPSQHPSRDQRKMRIMMIMENMGTILLGNESEGGWSTVVNGDRDGREC
jgi:hypothetical protein